MSYGDGSMGYGDGGSDFSDGSGKRSLVHDSVESVDGISGVVNGTYSAVGFHQTVCALDYITITALVLALGITGQSVLDVVSVAVLGMRVVVGVDSDGSSDPGDGGGSNSSYRGSIGSSSDGGTRSHDSGSSQVTGVGYSHQGGEDVQLQEEMISPQYWLYYATRCAGWYLL